MTPMAITRWRSPLERVSQLGQSVWIDWLSRDLLSSGGLQRLIAEHAVTGVATNPTILEHAIGTGHAYDDQIADLLAFDFSPREIATELIRADVSEAFAAHGRVAGTLVHDVERAALTLGDLALAGVDLARLTDELERDGIDRFARSLDELEARLGERERLAKAA